MWLPAWLLFLGHFVAVCFWDVSAVIVESDNYKVEQVEFGEATLSCRYQLEKKQVIRLEWKKMDLNGDSSIVFFNNSLTEELHKRAQMMDSSIRIMNLSRADSGQYRCEVSAPLDKKNFQEIIINLAVLVAPSVPVCDIPSSATSGSAVELKCREKEGNPASEYKWFRNGVPIERSAKTTNSTFKVDRKTGTLHFNTVTKDDTGEYYCEASNAIGNPQRCPAKRMQVDDLNLAGIISAVVIISLVIVLCGCGVCYAQRRGYFSGGKSKKEHNSATQAENDFKHTKSFVI
ncbi:junctional adhesion molecule B [Hyla sarda]|uniref:junctional adhesion molecule B n=1 Tax=Hyla sarda TaxID=327740 RepID=UPI0024C2CAE9|nr:junctional adhesion molecule B [Hyla sarda]